MVPVYVVVIMMLNHSVILVNCDCSNARLLFSYYSECKTIEGDSPEVIQVNMYAK